MNCKRKGFSTTIRRSVMIVLAQVMITGGGITQVTGLWSVSDEKDGIVKSEVEIFEENDRYYARVHKVLPTSKRTHCEKCTGDLKDQPLTGMIIISDLKKTPTGGVDGKVLNPATGKFYSCNIELESEDRLKLRGYLGVKAIGKTMYWNRKR